jgi:arylsulfatase A-like enzyme
MGLNVDFAPTFLDAAGVPVPADMQGRSLVPVMRGQAPADWRTSMYYRYYHDPGDHNTASHYGVRTRTHKLIHYWKLDQWELFDLVADPHEMHNLYGQAGHAALAADLKLELFRLKQAMGDRDQFAHTALPNGVDGPPSRLRGR